MNTRAESERRGRPGGEDSVGTRRPLRILIVENDVDTRTFFSLYLQQLGYDARGAGSVSEALSALAQARFDVLFVDIGLGDGSGWDLMNAVKERGIACPDYAVAMTGYGLPEDRARSTAAGFRHHLLKPFDTTRLKSLLDEAARELSDAG